MENENQKTAQNDQPVANIAVKTSFLQSNTAKMIMVGFLTLVLLIPLSFVEELIFERAQRKKKWSRKSRNFGVKMSFSMVLF